MILQQKLIFNELGDDSLEHRQLIGGNPTGIANLNSVKYKWASPLWNIMLNNFWIPQKTSLVDDRVTIKQLTKDELTAFKNTLSFLIALDSMQTANLPKLGDYITAPEVSAIVVIQAFQEQIHSNSYQYILQELFPSIDREEIYNYWRTNPHLLERNKYIASAYEAFNNERTHENYKRALAADFALEGIYFYNGFNFFYQLASRNKAANVAKIIKLIENDEMCLTADTEVMTIDGWKRIDSVTIDDVIYQYDVTTSECSFVKPLAITKKTTDTLYEFAGDICQTVTGPHRMILQDSNGNITESKASEICNILDDFDYVVSGNKSGQIKELTSEHIDLIAMSKTGKIDLFDWIAPIMNDIDSSWAKSFIDEWVK